MTNSETSVSGDGAIVFKLHMKRRVAGMTCSTAKTLLSQRGHLGADGRLPRFIMHAQVFNCCAAAASELFNCSVRAAQAVQVMAQRPALPLRNCCCSGTDAVCYSLSAVDSSPLAHGRPTPVQPLLHFQPFANIFTVVDEYTTALGPLATLQGTRPTAATSSQASAAAQQQQQR